MTQEQKEPKEEFLTPAELVQRWRKIVTTGTLANWRSKGTGPGFMKPCGGILYPMSEVRAYEARHMHANDNAPTEGDAA